MTGNSRKTMKQRLADGETLIGSLHDLVDPGLVEIVGWLGYDYVLLEHEHGLRNLESVQNLIRACEASGLDSIVRVGTTDAAMIQQCLEAGATGVMVAHVRTPQDAEDAVRAANYPPRGTRGEGYTRNGLIWDIGPGTNALHEEANRNAVVFAIIEDPEAVDCIDEILATPGLTGIAPGWADMATGMGGLALDSPEVVAQMAIIDKAARAVPGMQVLNTVFTEPSLKKVVDEGNQMVLWNHDVILIGNLYRDLLERTKAALAAAGRS